MQHGSKVLRCRVIPGVTGPLSVNVDTLQNTCPCRPRYMLYSLASYSNSTVRRSMSLWGSFVVVSILHFVMTTCLMLYLLSIGPCTTGARHALLAFQ